MEEQKTVKNRFFNVASPLTQVRLRCQSLPGQCSRHRWTSADRIRDMRLFTNHHTSHRLTDQVWRTGRLFLSLGAISSPATWLGDLHMTEPHGFRSVLQQRRDLVPLIALTDRSAATMATLDIGLPPDLLPHIARYIAEPGDGALFALLAPSSWSIQNSSTRTSRSCLRAPRTLSCMNWSDCLAATMK